MMVFNPKHSPQKLYLKLLTLPWETVKDCSAEQPMFQQGNWPVCLFIPDPESRIQNPENPDLPDGSQLFHNSRVAKN